MKKLYCFFEAQAKAKQNIQIERVNKLTIGNSFLAKFSLISFGFVKEMCGQTY